MVGSLRWLAAVAVASASALVLSTGAFASEHSQTHHSAMQTSQRSQPATVASGCDVPGKSCDPSKTDHDNGVGNNCDPGYGQGNQAKQPKSDDATTGCRAKPAEQSKTETEKSKTEESKTETEESKSKTEESKTEESQTEESKTEVVVMSSGEVEASQACAEQDESGAKSDNESENGVDHESKVAEAHDSGKADNDEDEDCTTSSSNQANAELESMTLVKITIKEISSNEFEMTLVGPENETTVVTVINNSGTLNVTINGETVSPSLLAMIQGMFSALPGGGFTITLPNGNVLTFTGGVLSENGVEIAPSSTLTLGSLPVSNSTAPSSLAPNGGVSAMTGTAPAGGAGAGVAGAGGVGAGNANRPGGNSGVGGVLGAAATAATGAPLAATGLPILAGLVGLALLGLGVAARRRD